MEGYILDMNTFTYTMADMVNGYIKQMFKDYKLYTGYYFNINHKSPAIIINDACGIVKYPMNGFFEDYNSGKSDIKSMASYIFTLYCFRRNTPAQDMIPKQEDIFFMTASATLNREYLSEVPHVRINDDLVAFYRTIRIKDGAEHHTALTYDMLSAMRSTRQFSDQELYQTALKNTRDRMPFDISESYIKYDPDNAHYIFLLGKICDTGSNIFLFPDVLRNVAEKEDADLIMAPIERNLIRMGSSKMFDVRSFDRFLADENSSVAINDYLSSQIYIYRKDLDTIEKVTNNPQVFMDNFECMKQALRR